MTGETPMRAWRVVLEKIEQDLLDGVYGPGDRLPPERELATTLDVGRSSVREALRVLEVMGLIRTGTGSGPTSGAIIVATPRGGLAQLLRLQVAAHGFPVDDVVQMRLILEEWTTGTLAVTPDPALSDAKATLEAMREPGLTTAEFLLLDAQFHLRLAEATGNQIVAATMAGLRTAIESYVLAGAERLADQRAASDRLIVEHHAIVDAIERGDPVAAAQLVRAHITGYYRATGLAGAD